MERPGKFTPKQTKALQFFCVFVVVLFLVFALYQLNTMVIFFASLFAGVLKQTRVLFLTRARSRDGVV